MPNSKCLKHQMNRNHVFHFSNRLSSSSFQRQFAQTSMSSNFKFQKNEMFQISFFQLCYSRSSFRATRAPIQTCVTIYVLICNTVLWQLRRDPLHFPSSFCFNAAISGLYSLNSTLTSHPLINISKVETTSFNLPVTKTNYKFLHLIYPVCSNFFIFTAATGQRLFPVLVVFILPGCFNITPSIC